MKNLKIYQKLGALALTMTTLCAAPQIAHADVDVANEVLDGAAIIYEQNDSLATDLVVNAGEVYETLIRDGKIANAYDGMLIDPILTLDSLNQMRENLLNHNISSLFTNPEEFQYISMGIYMNDENEKAFLTQVASLVEQYALNPTDVATLDRLITIFRGQDKELSTAMLSVGGNQALANDVYFVSALVQVYGLDESYVQAMNDLALSYGNNGNIITYINAIAGKSNCR